MAKSSVGLRSMWLNRFVLWMFTISCIYAQPDCNYASCGNVEIPYPFGVGEGCYKDKDFEIICNNSIPFLGISGNEVKEINLEDSQVRVWVQATKICSGKNSGENIMVFPDLTQSQLTLSNSTYLYGIGCDLSVHVTDSNNSEPVTWCKSPCTDAAENSDVADDSDAFTIVIIPSDGFIDVGVHEVVVYPIHYFSEKGVFAVFQSCYTAVPESLKAFNLTMDGVSSNSGGCSYAGIFNLQNFAGTKNTPDTVSYWYEKNNLYVAAALDWALGNETCEEAERNSTTFECRANNSHCTESTNGPGYRCNCNKGYSGNPYIDGGCTDRGCSACVAGAVCDTTRTNPRCYCDQGYGGNGYKMCTPTVQIHNTDHTSYSFTATGILGGAGLFVFLAGGVFLVYRIFKKRKQIKLKKKFFRQNGGLLLEQQFSSDERNNERTKIFVAEDFERATDNFSENRIIGTGGSGTVYKGMLSDGRAVAIKKSKVVDESQIGQFINELVILCQINHRHVVQVIGCCLDTEVPLLAYEFISNGTLSHHLHDEDCKSSLSWDNRLRIATEISGALSYMHSSTTRPIFHRDIKTCNILLDEKLRAKVSDFGISKSVPFENTHLTTIVKGTYGYLDPEYYYSGQFTDKSDVYSFGVVLTELLTGEKPFSTTRVEDESYLVMQFTSSVEDNSILEMLEPRVLGEGNKEELLVVAKLAQRCLQLQGKKRPTMREVTLELEQLRPVDKQQYIPPNDQADSIARDSSRASTSRLESEETTLIWENRT